MTTKIKGESVETTRKASKYKINISKRIAVKRAKEAWKTRRNNGTIIPWNKGKKNSQIAWNKGLTVISDERVAKYTKSMTATTRKQFALGIRKAYIHSEETNNKMSLSKMGDRNPMRIYPHLREISRRNAIKTLLKLNWKATSIEKKLWNELEKNNISFLKNYNLKNKTIPDAYILDKKIAIYADGDYWHNLKNWKERDIRINLWLKENGYTAIRFWEHEINSKEFPEIFKLRMKI